MAANAVPGFLPSRYGLHFRNSWPSGPARTIDVGPIHIPIGDVGRGLCGGMAFVARDLFTRGVDAPPDRLPPAPSEPLFKEVVDRQFDSFGTLFVVPLRFWLASVASQASRTRESVRDAWPAIRAAIDAGQLPMVGLIRAATWNPLALDLGHQVVAYRYDESATAASFWIYDPNHPDDDDVRMTLTKRADGTYDMAQSTAEPVLGLLALPFSRAG